jgi:cytoskeleton protein RodZ
VSLEDISRATRVPTRFLEALETEQFDSMPAPVFIRGFIRAYCEAVGASSDDALALYHPAGETEAPPPRSTTRLRASASGNRGRRARGPVLVSLGLLGVLGVALAAVTLVLRPGRETPMIAVRQDVPPAGSAGIATATPDSASAAPANAAAGETEASPTLPSSGPDTAVRTPEPPATPAGPVAAVVPPAAPAPPRESPPPSALPRPNAATPAPVPGTAGPGPGRPAQNGSIVGAVTSPYRLVARAVEPTWIRVRMDDGRSSEETIPAGETREWVSNSPFVLTVGNAAGLTLELNGEKLPPLGGKGVVVPRLVIPPPPQQ